MACNTVESHWSRRQDVEKGARRTTMLTGPVASAQCPICANTAVFTHKHRHADIFRCPSCTHRFSQINPGAAEAYNAEYFTETHRNYFKHPNVALYERIASYIDREREPKSMIDVGCGTGSLLRFLKRRTPTVALTGIDVAPPVVPDFEFIQGDILSLPLDRKFSIVATLGTIEHIPNVKSFVRRLKSLSAPRALIIVMTINEDSTLYLAARSLHAIGIKGPFDRLYGHHHVHHFTKKSLARLFQEQGVTIEETILHNSPLESVDIPVSDVIAGSLLKAAVGGLFLSGSVLGKTYLQTLIMRAGH
jgi:2-polyprenyl-3-methyl-5-hydroxy-6-metoxy-1,4-benzoquinol methylase